MDTITLEHILNDEYTLTNILGLLETGMSFDRLAHQYSVNMETQPLFGNMGEVVRGQFPKEVEDILFALEIGQVTGIIKINDTFQLFKRIQ